MKNKVVVFCLLLFVLLVCSVSGFTQGVDVEELKKNLKEGIVFINYTGKPEFVETSKEIIGIGKKLAELVKSNGREGRISLKYSVYHAVAPDVSHGLDADIISIDKDATVDHIDNIRRIVSGYLEGYYGYSLKDAELLAKFITIYNAVFRGNIDFFKKVYKPVVMSYISRENAGLSTKYYEWPGRTRMVIPLTPEAGKGSLSSISTSEVTEKKVVEQMRKKQGKGLNERKEMVQLKEREVTEKSTKLTELQKSLKKEQKAKAVLEGELAKEKQTLEKKKRSSTASSEEIKKQEKKVKELETKAAEQEKAVKEKKKTVTAQSQAIEEKNKEIKAERQQIAEDQTAVLAETAASGKTAAVTELQVKSITDTLYYLNLAGNSGSTGRNWSLIIIDPQKQKITEKASGLNNSILEISEKKLMFAGGRILVTAYVDNSRKTAKLFSLDPRKLTPVYVSDYELYPSAYILPSGKFIYAVVSEGSEYFLGKFDSSLKLVTKSKTQISPDSYITVFNKVVYLNAKNGSIVSLDTGTLKEVFSVVKN
ncbi:MAG: hypothetical protein GXP33_02650 [Spirochaetes bacterium]|nr:hypothetical protein [Spirochaetota bacterium]